VHRRHPAPVAEKLQVPDARFMKLRWVLLFGLVCACKGKDKPAAGNVSTAVGGSAVVADAAAVVAVDAAAAEPALTTGVLRFDDGGDDDVRRIAFDKKAPVLPAVSHDGKWLADWHSDAGGPMPVPPLSVVVTSLDGQGKDEVLELATFDDVAQLDSDLAVKLPKPALTKRLQERAAAVTQRLAAFESLEEVDAKAFKVESVEGEDGISRVVTLTTAAGKRVRRETFDSYSTGSGDDQCNFSPMEPTTYEDQNKTRIYVEVRFRFRDDCGMPPPAYVVWDLKGEDPDPGAALAKDAVAIAGSVVGPAVKVDGEGQLAVAKAADGKSAWASFVGKDKRRASYVLAAEPGGTWNIIAVTATKAVANAAANADAKAGKLAAPAAFTVEPGDEGLRAAFAKLTTEGLKAPSPSLVAFGSGPGERTTTGEALAKGWNAGWKGKTTIASSIARLAPSGTTGWVAANVALAKTGYTIPFHLFAVFDKASSGEWTLVHLHFSVPPQ
jgi:SnoaL-like domain